MKTKTFKTGIWNKTINLRDFVTQNITPYHGTHDFLEGASEKTLKLWEICKQGTKEERQRNGVRSVDTDIVSGINAFKAGYIDKDNEVIVGLQTDELLKRAMKPFGGFKVVEKALSEHGLKPNDQLVRFIYINMLNLITMVCLMLIQTKLKNSVL